MTIDVTKAVFSISDGMVVIETGGTILTFPVQEADMFSRNLDLIVALQ